MVPGRMGKSEGNAIYLVDDAATIRKKVMKAVTDSGPTEPNSVKPEVIQNLFTLMGCRFLRKTRMIISTRSIIIVKFVTEFEKTVGGRYY